MKGLESFGGSNKLARAARLKVLVVPLLLVFACVFAARPAPTAQQSTAEVCRETEKVLEQYRREERESKDVWEIKLVEGHWHEQLSELRRVLFLTVSSSPTWMTWQERSAYPHPLQLKRGWLSKGLSATNWRFISRKLKTAAWPT